MKLEELLKDSPDVLKAVTDAIAKVNEGKSDKLEHVRFADLSEGEYVSKAKYTALDAENQTNTTKLTEANNLIQQLQKAAKGDEALQGQVTAYQTKVQELETELAQTKIDAAIKVGLLAENAVDVDYLTFKLKEKGEKMELDEQGNIKGWSDKVAALKTQLPTQFQDKGKGGYEGFRPLDKNNQQNQDKGMTRAELLKKPYAEQVKFFNENPDAYNEIMKG
ncbi:phage scaffolding protein [Lachnospiraceae bacterium 56-18]